MNGTGLAWASRAVGIVLVGLVASVPAGAQTSSLPPDDASAASGAEPGDFDLTDLISRYLFRGDDEGEEETEEGEPDLTGGRLFAFPTFGGNPAIGFAVGGLLNFTNYWGDPATTPLSSMVVSVSFTTRRQFLVVARSDFYLPDDSWHLVGDWRYYDFLERTHGLGSSSASDVSFDIDYDWGRLHQTLYRPVWAGLEVGVGYHLDSHDNIALSETQPDGVEPLETADPIEAAATRSSGLSANVVFDRRDNPLNAYQGVYGRASIIFFREGLGGDDNWESLQFEGRAFRRLPGPRRQRIAYWGIGWLTRGDAPYFDLPSVGWDTYGRTGRGYRAGRFRGRDWIYQELEYRTDVTRNGLIGAVGFVNVSTLSDPDGRYGRWRVGGGGGARIKLDKERRSNISVDVGVGQEGSVGVFLALNEAF